MSYYPGYPSPFSAWDPLTSTYRSPFPVGNPPFPGIPCGFPVSTLPSPLTRFLPISTLFPNPLTLATYRPAFLLPTRYLYGNNDFPIIGLDSPLHGFGLQEPRDLHLLHSPNFPFSDNPSPLTFDQIYKSSDVSSVSPVSQYRNHLDQRHLGSRLGFSGSVSEPIQEKSKSKILKSEGKSDLKKSKDPFVSHRDINKEKDLYSSQREINKDKDRSSSHSDINKEKELSGPPKYTSKEQSNDLELTTEKKKVKIWNPFESDKLEKGIESVDQCNETESKSLDANGNDLRKAATEIFLKAHPEKPIPHYPLRPAIISSYPVKSNNNLGSLQDFGSQVYDRTSNTDRSVGGVSADIVHKKIIANDCITFDAECSILEVKEFKENSEIFKDSNCEKEDQVNKPNLSIELNDGEAIVKERSEISNKTDEIDKNHNHNSVKLVDLCGANHTVPNVCKSSNESNVNYISDLSKGKLQTVDLGVPCTSDISESVINTTSLPQVKTDSKNLKELIVEVELCHSSALPVSSSPKGNISLGSKSKVQKKDLKAKDELIQLSILVNEVRNRKNCLFKDINTNTVLLSPIDTTKTSCLYTQEKQLSHPTVDKIVGSVCHKLRMSSVEGSVSMLKHTEDSLASISSSQISESDSDTQMSTDHTEKLFQESQPINTQLPPPYPINHRNGGGNYMPSNSASYDSQFFKTNSSSMCQSEIDNQKSCVQNVNFFNDKSQILPPFHCYTSNLSANMIPREPHDESSNFSQSLGGVDSSIDYDENSVMSEPNHVSQECDSHISVPQILEPHGHGENLLDPSREGLDPNAFQGGANPNAFVHDPDQWDFYHSKQYIENIYGNQLGCEVVKSEEESLRESDSPKTFIDLDKTTKEKKAEENMQKTKPKEAASSKHYNKAYTRPGYSGPVRQGASTEYGNHSFDNYGNIGGKRWNNFGRGDGMIGNPPRSGGDGYGPQYEQTPNQFRNFPPSYSQVNQGQNDGNQPGFHANEHNQNDFYSQNQPVKNYQGNYGNSSRFDNNYYQSKASGEYGIQGNIYPANSVDMQQGPRFSNQVYNEGQGNYGQHYSQQGAGASHSSPHDNIGQYQEHSNYSIPRNASPVSIGSDFSNMEPPTTQKKRGRKRKIDKEPPDENKPRPNTIVMAPTKIGPLIDIDNPECTIDTYDFNNQIETIFNFTIEDDLSPIGAQFLQIEQRLCQKMLPIKYGFPVTVVYSPLTYAFQTHRDFVAKYCSSERTLLFLGMNPGPYGMSQNGVPFGEAVVTREWLKITGDIYKPEIEHPKKPVTGLACTRNEVSGARFWGLFQKMCKIPENFFKNSYVYNFCPLAYMSESGKNITPPQLVHAELDQINEACDVALVELVKLLNTRMIISVGKFVQQRASKALHNAGISNIKVECILHPSPINPHANKGWEQIVAKQLIEMNIMHYLNSDAEDVQRCIEEWERISQSNMKVPIVDKVDY